MKTMQLKQANGWFAADDSFKHALLVLSDGAFKLFACLSLEAERATGRLSFRQGELAEKLGKSRRSIGTYLQELKVAGICRILPSPNQHAGGTLEISPEYWPYTCTQEQTTEEPSAEIDYIEAIEQLYGSLSCISHPFSQTDRRLVQRWFRRAVVPLEAVEQAILLGCGRKFVAWLNGDDSQPVGSLYYFIPVLEKVLSHPRRWSYWTYVSSRTRHYEKLWQDRQHTHFPQSACANFAQARPF